MTKIKEKRKNILKRHPCRISLWVPSKEWLNGVLCSGPPKAEIWVGPAWGLP